MSVKFKISPAATEQSVKDVLKELGERGLVADPMFPKQKRAALARMFIIRSPDARVTAVSKALEQFGGDVEYVEGAVKRKPMSSRGTG